ncbi:MAG: DUF6624 domain-containing protein [Bacteroidota bacterium]
MINLIEKCGWKDQLSEDSHRTIFLVLQHADLTIIERFISLVEEKVSKNLLSKDDSATMQDRLLMYQGKRQLYGTQTIAQDNGKVNLLWLVENAGELAERRKNMEMISLEDYFKIARDSFNIEMRWDTTLMLEQAIQMNWL